uniref:Uncharacterized protein n=1 Tax=Biomphalaria glabrata TaxID=6526 RepID=A0A2C9MAG0_BIOGL
MSPGDFLTGWVSRLDPEYSTSPNGLCCTTCLDMRGFKKEMMDILFQAGVGAYTYSGKQSLEILPAWTSPVKAGQHLWKLRLLPNSGSWTSSGLRNIVTGPRYNDSLLFLITSQGSSYTTRRTQAIAEANRVKSLGWRIIVIALQSRNALDDIELSSIDPDYQNNIISGQDKNYYGLADKVNDIINQKCTMSTTSSTSAQTTTVSETTTEALWTTARSSSTATMTTAFTATDSTLETLTTAFTATDSTLETLTTAFTATDSTTATAAPLMDNRTAAKDPACPPIELTFLLDQSQPACDAASSRFKYNTNNITKFNILEDQLKIVLDYLAEYNSTDTSIGAYGYSGAESIEIIPYWSPPTNITNTLEKLRSISSIAIARDIPL